MPGIGGRSRGSSSSCSDSADDVALRGRPARCRARPRSGRRARARAAASSGVSRRPLVPSVAIAMSPSVRPRAIERHDERRREPELAQDLEVLVVLGAAGRGTRRGCRAAPRAAPLRMTAGEPTGAFGIERERVGRARASRLGADRGASIDDAVDPAVVAGRARRSTSRRSPGRRAARRGRRSPARSARSTAGCRRAP